MAFAQVSWERRKFGQTMRRDRWWLTPLLVLLGLGAFVVYTTWAAFQGKNYYWGPYLSPFYSPEVFGDPERSWFGLRPSWLPVWVTAAMVVLWAPGGFRLQVGVHFEVEEPHHVRAVVRSPELRVH